MADNTLNITKETINDFCVICVSGRIDSSNAASLTEKLNALIADGAVNLLLDLAQLAYLTSAGFRALLIVGDEAEEQGGSLALCNVSGDVRELFEMGGLLDVFVIHDSRDKALNG